MSSAEAGPGHVRLIRELSNELAAYLYSLTEDVWRDAERYPSGCTEWTMADVVAHLNGEAHDAALSIQRALRSDASPPMGYSPVDRHGEVARVISARMAYDEDLFPEFNAGCAQLNTLLASLGPEHSNMQAWHRGSVAPLSRLVEYRAAELAIHGWDVRYGTDRLARLGETSVGFLMDWLPGRLRSAFREDGRLPAPVRYRFQIGVERHDVVLSVHGCSVEIGATEAPNVVFTCDADTFVLFAIGRLPFARSVRRGRLSFDGDQTLAARFPEWFEPK
jgi:uncharacterized protein (TIGR03083 family)